MYERLRPVTTVYEVLEDLRTAALTWCSPHARG